MSVTGVPAQYVPPPVIETTVGKGFTIIVCVPMALLGQFASVTPVIT